MAYLHKGAPALVRLFSLKSHEDVHLLRLTEPAKHLQASRRFLAVGFAKQVELFDALHFQVLFSHSERCLISTKGWEEHGRTWDWIAICALLLLCLFFRAVIGCDRLIGSGWFRV